jgi:hypothetical protein
MPTFKRHWVEISHLFQPGYDHRYQYMTEGYTSGVNGNRQGFLNNYTALCTFFAVGFPWNTSAQIKLSHPDTHDQDPTGGDHSFDLGNLFTPDRVSEVKLHPLLPVVVVRTTAATSHPAGLYMFDPARGWAPIGDVSGPGHMAFGRKGELFVSDGPTLKLVRMDAWERNSRVVRTIDLPRPPDAMAYDEATDTLVVVDRLARQATTYTRTLKPADTRVALPPELTDPGSAGSPINLVYDPATRGLWAAREGSQVLVRVTGNPTADTTPTFERAKLPAMISPESLNFTDRGGLVGWAGGDIVEFERDGSGRFVQRPSTWTGRGFGPKFCLSRSRSGADPALAATPVLDAPGTSDTPEFVECQADLTGPRLDGIPDGVVGDEDREMFMRLWMEGSPRADIDDGSGRGRQDGRVDDSDLAFFLSKYADGC